MKAEKFTYERLFNLTDYNNERIGITISLDEENEPGKAITEAIQFILKLHNALEILRLVQNRLRDVVEGLRIYQNRIVNINEEIAREERKYKEMKEFIASKKEEEVSPDMWYQLKRKEEDLKSLKQQVQDVNENFAQANVFAEDYRRIKEFFISQFYQGKFELLSKITEEHPELWKYNTGDAQIINTIKKHIKEAYENADG